MPVMSVLLGIVSGGFVGFTLGLIGGGGSILATPLMLYVVGVAQPHIAIGTSALAVSVNSYANFFSHARAGTVRWRAAVVFALVGVVGAYFGSTLGKIFDGQRLLFLFGLVMIAVGLSMLRRKASVQGDERPVGLQYDLRVAAIALLAGAASGFFGIGGGFLIVPALMISTRMKMINAVGTSLFAVGSFGLTTALNYAFSGLVDWPLALEFIIGGVAGGLIGMRLALRLSNHRNALNRIFAAIIFLVAIYVLYRSGRVLFG